MEVHRWFERKFKLDLPLVLYPNVVERLRGVPARLEELLSGVPVETLTRKKDQEWSMQEHAGHLLDLEVLGLQRLDDYESGLSDLTAADLKNTKTYDAHHNDRPIRSLLAEFREQRIELVRRFEGFDEEFIKRTAIHPRLQLPMRVIDLAFFTAEHDDHHLATISRLMRSAI